MGKLRRSISEAEQHRKFGRFDAVASRLVDHTSFDRYVAHMLPRLGCVHPEQLLDFIRL